MLYVRFIPAHAGNTLLIVPSEGICAVHPRACGEHLDVFKEKRADIGSSPRMRGTPVGDDCFVMPHRFIPAHAGNTPGTHNKGTGKAVHPRACGEH